ncbi:hypothetical protein Sjap_003690 [Stephania japonica]|uniref:CW-type domain-containing protein n=1 Tax=Stephania japonica TaxID=461633 RepID=A0AAP0KRY0_9MAGN
MKSETKPSNSASTAPAILCKPKQTQKNAHTTPRPTKSCFATQTPLQLSLLLSKKALDVVVVVVVVVVVFFVVVLFEEDLLLQSRMRGGEIGAEEAEEGVAAAQRRLRGPLRLMRIWQSSSFVHPPLPERLKDLSVIRWNPVIGPNADNGQLRPPFNVWNISAAQSERQLELPIKGECVEIFSGKHYPPSSLEKKKLEESTFSNLNPVGVTKLVNVTPLDALRYSHTCKEENDIQERKVNASEASCVLGTTSVARLNGSASISLQSSTSNDPKKNPSGLSMPSLSPNEKVVPNNNSGNQSHEQTPAPLFNMHLYADPPNGGDSSGRTHLSNGRSRGDGRGRNQLLPRYWPKISDQELQHISGASNSAITPLFEKMLSASDAGRIGRLVLPKKCAEETESLKTGNDVLRNADINHRQPKLNADSTNQVNAADSERRCSTVNELDSKAKETPGNSLSTEPCKRKSSIIGSKSKRLRMEHKDLMEVKLTWEQAQGLLRPPPNHVPQVVIVEGHEFEEYEQAPVLGKPSIVAGNHVGDTIQWVQCDDCSKWRKLPIDALLPSRWTCSDNPWDLKRSRCSAAQEVPTEHLKGLLVSDKPANASRKRKVSKRHIATAEESEGLETLANLAILGEGETLANTQPTTKHPRHRPGCTCIVCIQPPSGKGPKHKDSCTCSLCLTVKRRFRTLMMRREKRQSEKEAESARRKLHMPTELPDRNVEDEHDVKLTSDIGIGDPIHKIMLNENGNKSPSSPFKPQIDLNIQPEERDSASSPVSDSGIILPSPLRDISDMYQTP